MMGIRVARTMVVGSDVNGGSPSGEGRQKDGAFLPKKRFFFDRNGTDRRDNSPEGRKAREQFRSPNGTDRRDGSPEGRKAREDYREQVVRKERAREANEQERALIEFERYARAHGDSKLQPGC